MSWNPDTELTLDLGLDEPDDDESLRAKVARKLRTSVSEVPPLVVHKRAIDARGGRVRFHLTLGVRAPAPQTLAEPAPREVTGRPVVIVGDGPAGLFCAWELARAGVASIVLDRGKPVQARRKDLKGLTRDGVVDEDSNYCFGEGGAGTYSDGKLYTRSHKRGDVRDVMEILALSGAPEKILVDARPHIGSNKLPRVITAMRERLEALGVVFRFGARVTGLVRNGDHIRGVRLGDEVVEAREVVLATGHSARDVYEFTREAGVRMEAKAFAMGVRIEHPQPLIDRIQYGKDHAHPKLPAAYYRIAHTPEDGRGVFSFCMCPGGWIVPASTEADGLVVNGMSLSRRDSPYANSGLIVGIEVADAQAAMGTDDVFAGLDLQRRLERAALHAGGEGLKAPGQRVSDFLQNRPSTTLPPSSYHPGLTPTDVGAVLSASGLPLDARMRDALQVFGRKLRGFVTEEAVLIGVESRTSSPVRIPRDADTLEAPDLPGLYPTGEGAGYAGGIVSAAVDGMRVARAIVSARTHRAHTRL